MYRLLVVCSLAAAAAALPAFSGDPGSAAILAETRKLGPDGSADVAYAQEDGVFFKEATNKDGERRGSYRYIGDDNKTYEVEYSAGVQGFRILKSTHVDATPDLPSGPSNEPQPQPQPQPQPKPAPKPVNTGNVFNIHYDLSQSPTSAPRAATHAPAATTTTTTTTTTPRPVRKNYHTGKVSLDRNDSGYVYSYTHTG